MVRVSLRRTPQQWRLVEYEHLHRSFAKLMACREANLKIDPCCPRYQYMRIYDGCTRPDCTQALLFCTVFGFHPAFERKVKVLHSKVDLHSLLQKSLGHFLIQDVFQRNHHQDH